MVDPVGVVSLIIQVVQLIRTAAATALQNKEKCLELAERATILGYALPDYAMAAANNMATVHGLQRLGVALEEAFRVIQSCQQPGGIFSGFSNSGKAAELDNVNAKINNWLLDLSFFSLAHGPTMTTHHVTAASGSYYQPQGGYLGFAPPQQGPVHPQWLPPPAPDPYAAYPAPSGYNYASFYTLPTVNKIFDSVFR